MKIKFRFFSLVLCLMLLFSATASAGFEFSDDRFVGDFTTENLDRIIEEYELYDGWYWTTRPYVTQTFHALEDTPGWTSTAVNVYERRRYEQGYYGCRWNANIVIPEHPDLGWGECFGFASFIGYLLSGETNPHGRWTRFYSLKAAGDLRVGDIIRTEFDVGEKSYHHSAVVYSVSEDEILFLQLSGSLYNRILVGEGFMDGYHRPMITMEELANLPNVRVCRSPLNMPELTEEE